MEIWNETTLQYLRSVTRDALFDFNKVSESVIRFCLQVNPDLNEFNLRTAITPEECRHRFAADYTATNEQKPKPIIDESKLSFEEIIEQQELRQEENARRQDILFRRVLESLRTESSTEVDIDPEVQAALLAQKLRKEIEKEKKEKRIREQRERELLEAQREALRTRFEPGSVDAIGIDPLAETKLTEHALHADNNTSTTSSSTILNPILDSFNMSDFLSNPYFDQLLDTVERELFFSAADKTDNEAAATTTAVQPPSPSSSVSVSASTPVVVASDNSLLPHNEAKKMTTMTMTTTSNEQVNASVVDSRRDDVSGDKVHDSQEKEKHVSPSSTDHTSTPVIIHPPPPPSPVTVTSATTMSTTVSMSRDIQNNLAMGSVRRGYGYAGRGRGRDSGSRSVSHSEGEMAPNYDSNSSNSNSNGTVAFDDTELDGVGESNNNNTNNHPLGYTNHRDTGAGTGTGNGDNKEDSDDSEDEDWRRTRQQKKMSSTLPLPLSHHVPTQIVHGSKAVSLAAPLTAPTMASSAAALAPATGVSSDAVWGVYRHKETSVVESDSDNEEDEDDDDYSNDDKDIHDADDEEVSSESLSQSQSQAVSLNPGLSTGNMSHIDVGEEGVGLGETSRVRENVEDMSPSLSVTTTDTKSGSGSVSGSILDRRDGGSRSGIGSGASRRKNQNSLQESVAAARQRRVGKVEKASTIRSETLTSTPSSSYRKGKALTETGNANDVLHKHKLEADVVEENEAAAEAETEAEAQRLQAWFKLCCPTPCPPIVPMSGVSTSVDVGTCILMLSWQQHHNHYQQYSDVSAININSDMNNDMNMDMAACIGGFLDWTIATAVVTSMYDIQGISLTCERHPVDDIQLQQQQSKSTSTFHISTITESEELASTSTSTSTYRVTILLHDKSTASLSSNTSLQTLREELASVHRSPAPLLRDTTTTTTPRGMLVRMLHDMPGTELILLDSDSNKVRFITAMQSIQSYSYSIHNPNTTTTTSTTSTTTDDLKEWELLRDNRLACLVMKNYTISTKSKSNAFSTLLNICELSGLQLCGMRSVYASSTSTSKSTSSDHCKDYVHPDISRYFSTNTTSPLLILTFISVNGEAANTKLREALGPDDPDLARRTDPHSARALLSSSKEDNLAFPLPCSADHVWKDASYWIGPRLATNSTSTITTTTHVVNSAANGGYVTHSVCTVLLPRTTYVHVGISLRSTDTVISTLSFTQLRIMTILSDLSSKGLILESMRTLPMSALSECFHNLTTSPTGSSVSGVCHIEDDLEFDDNAPNWSLLCTFSTVASKRLLRAIAEVFIEDMKNLSNYISDWTPNVWINWSSYDWTMSEDFLQRWTITTEETAAAATGAAMSSNSMSPSNLIADHDLRSHEDVGVADVCIVSLPLVPSIQFTSQVHGTNSNSNSSSSSGSIRYNQHPVMRLLSSIPSYSGATIIGITVVSTTTSSTSGGESASTVLVLLVCVRRNVDKNKTISSAPSSSSSSSSSFKVLTGRAALQTILQHFVYQPSSQSMTKTTSTSTSTAVEKVVEIEKEFILWRIAEADLRRNMPSWLSSTTSRYQSYIEEGHIVTKSLQIASTLFPPGSFVTASVVLLAWEAVREKRALAKVLKRLHVVGGEERGNGCSLVQMRPFLMDADSAEALAVDHENEFGVLSLPSDGSEASSTSNSSSKVKMDSKAVCTAAVGSAWLALLISGNGLLRKLPAIVGPSMDTELASKSFPNTAEVLANRIFGSNLRLTLEDLLQGPILVDCQRSSTSSSSSSTAAAAAAVLSYEEQVKLADGMRVSEAMRRESEMFLISQPQSHSREIVVLEQKKSANTTTTNMNASVMNTTSTSTSTSTSTLSSELVRNRMHHLILPSMAAEVVCLVLTAALLEQKGFGNMLDVLDKEGLKVVNARSMLLTSSSARMLMEMTGQSSLTMKPTLTRLVEAPVLLLAVEGSAHAVSRLKGLTMETSTSVEYERRGWGEGTRVMESLWQLQDKDKDKEKEWGVLASSSTRLARTLLLRCFSELYSIYFALVWTSSSNYLAKDIS
eukprot:gene3924-7827_t